VHGKKKSSGKVTDLVISYEGGGAQHEREKEKDFTQKKKRALLT